MELFQIKYEIKSQRREFTVSIVAKTKEKAVDKIYRRVGAIRVHSLSSKGTVHVIDDELVDVLVDNSGKVEKYKKKIKNQDNLLKDYEYELESLKEQLDSYKQKPAVSSKDIKDALKGNQQSAEKVYVCPYCSFESSSKQGVKMHASKMHKEE